MSNNSEKLVKDIQVVVPAKSIPLKKRSELCWKVCVEKKVSLSCAAGKD